MHGNETAIAAEVVDGRLFLTTEVRSRFVERERGLNTKERSGRWLLGLAIQEQVCGSGHNLNTHSPSSCPAALEHTGKAFNATVCCYWRVVGEADPL